MLYHVAGPVSPSRSPFPTPRGRTARRPTSAGEPATVAVRSLREGPGPERGAAVRVRTDVGARIDVLPVMPAGPCTVVVSGEVDCLTAPDLRAVLLEVLDRPDFRGAVVVDLSRVTLLTAAGLSALVLAHRTADRASRALRIRCGTARAVLCALQTTGLWSALTVIEHEEQLEREHDALPCPRTRPPE